jgi:hypothetical protein
MQGVITGASVAGIFLPGLAFMGARPGIYVFVSPFTFRFNKLAFLQRNMANVDRLRHSAIWTNVICQNWGDDPQCHDNSYERDNPASMFGARMHVFNSLFREILCNVSEIVLKSTICQLTKVESP